MATDESKHSRISRRDALRIGTQAGLGLAVASAAGTTAEAQTGDSPLAISITRETITFAAATALIAAAVARANAIGVPMAIAVVDESGVLKAFGRMDGRNSSGTVEIVDAKAFTAATFGVPTHVLAERNRADLTRVASLPDLTRVTLLGGGYAIRSGATVIGGIGVGGGTVQQDMDVAEAALRALGLSQ
jgi:uncharacterized protein GlcG (DUF336 family)